MKEIFRKVLEFVDPVKSRICVKTVGPRRVHQQ